MHTNFGIKVFKNTQKKALTNMDKEEYIQKKYYRMLRVRMQNHQFIKFPIGPLSCTFGIWCVLHVLTRFGFIILLGAII